MHEYDVYKDSYLFSHGSYNKLRKTLDTFRNILYNICMIERMKSLRNLHALIQLIAPCYQINEAGTTYVQGVHYEQNNN